MKNLSAEFKVGIFAIVVIMFLSYMTFKIGGMTFTWKQGYRLSVVFDNISGLDEKSRIKIAGVDAGIVEKIRLKNGKADLTLLINPGINIYKDAKALLRVSGLLGDKYLAIWSGSPDSPLLENGDMIEHIEPAVDIDELANELTAAASNINDLIESLVDMIGKTEKKAITETIDNLRIITGNLNEIIKEGKEPLKTILARIEDFTITMSDKGPGLLNDLSMASRELKEVIEENRDTLKESLEHIKTFSESADRIIRRAEEGEGTLGKLLKDEELYESLNSVAASAGKSFEVINSIRTFMDFRAEYITDGSWKGYFDLTLQPRKDKYYIFGVVSDPMGATETVDTVVNGVAKREKRTESKIEFTAQFARRFKDFALRVGMTENTFGFGTDYFLLNDKARISLNMWDFNALEAKAERAHLKIGLDYMPFRYIFISGGIDNILNNENSGIYLGGGLKFEDEDLKYILGTLF